MVDITPALPKDHHLIQSYGAGRFVVQNQEIASNLLVWAGGFMALEDEISPVDIPSIIDPLPELVIIGTGITMKAVNPEIKEAIKKHGISVDAMDTGAACRTYNVLISEDRRVAALLTLV